MKSRKEISQRLGMTEQYLSMLLKGRKVSWPLAEKLSDLFPGKTIQQWKKASPEDLKNAFAQLNAQAQGAA